MSSTANSALLLLSAALALQAHMVSMSTGEIRVEGTRARYEFRVPLYEVAHVTDPEHTLLDAIQFSSAGQPARRTEGKCQRDTKENALICVALYEFQAPVDVLHAVSSFHKATVSNHVHLLRAVKGDVTDQAVLDLSFPQADVRFRPPGAGELAWQHSGGGALRALSGPAQWLFIAALVLAARSRRELLQLAAMLFAGELAAAFVVPQTAWQPAPAFVEAAAALTVAYLAVEILAFPDAGQRWLVVLALGAFHGLYFSMFTTASGYRTGWVMLGALLAETLQIAAAGWVFSRLARPLEAWRPVRAAAALLLVTGLAWFALRLKG
jgi:HupE / UreJ protein